jgi:hypothetical protein
MNLLERFEKKIERIPIAGCWLWTGCVGNQGYGEMKGPARLKLATHRVAWELYVGPVPDGKCVLHRCDIRCCVNPSHLFIGDLAENARDMWRKGRGSDPPGAIERRLQTHCTQGHEFINANTYFYFGKRQCKQCNRDAQKKYKEKKKRASC